MQYGYRTKKTLTSIALFAILFVGVMTPVGPHGVQHSHAQLGDIGAGIADNLLGGLFGDSGLFGGGGNGVEIVLDTSPTSVARTIMETEQKVKEQVLDPLFSNLAQASIGSMIDTLVSWVNDTGNGEPAFIESYPEYFQEAKDEAAIKHLNNAGIDELCESFSVDVKSALTKQYAMSRPTDDADIERQQCELANYTEDEEGFRMNFHDGGWGAWFTLTMDCYSDPVCAYEAEKQKQNEKTNESKQQAAIEAVANQGFKNVEECDAIDEATGVGINCGIRTPGIIVKEQLANTLNVPNLRLAFADELDETVGAFLGNIGTQALAGVGGLSGLNSDEQRNFGSTGDLTFLEALSEETSEAIAGANTVNILRTAIEQQLEYAAILVETVTAIDELSEKIDDAEEEHAECFSVKMTPELTDARDAANTRTLEAGQRVEDLIDLYTALQDPDITDAERAQIAMAVGTYNAEVDSQIESAIKTATNDRDVILPTILEPLEEEVDEAIIACGGTVDDEEEDGDDEEEEETASSTEAAVGV